MVENPKKCRCGATLDKEGNCPRDEQLTDSL